MNYKIKIDEILTTSSEKELEIYYHILKAEKLKIQ